MSFVFVFILWFFLGGDLVEFVKVVVVGFEGDYGGVVFEDEFGGFGIVFEGFNGVFGGGFDVLEFGVIILKSKDKEFGGLGLLVGVIVYY